MAEKIPDNVARRCKQKAARRLDPASLPCPEQALIGFLDDIIDVARPYQAMQVVTQRRFMRLYVGAEPDGKFGLGRGHDFIQ